MKNYQQDGNVLTLVAPAGGVVSGQGYMIGGLFCVAMVTAAAGEEFAAVVDGVVELTKAAAFDPAQGAQAFWDNTAKALKASAAGYFPIGVYANDPGSSDTLAKVKILGQFRTAVA